jgi:hypothetical protein
MIINTFQLLLLIIVSLTVIQCTNSGSASQLPLPTPTPLIKTTVVSNGTYTLITDGGEITGKVSELTITDSKLESILKHPVPEIWFVFSCEEQSTVDCVEGKEKKELPDKVKTLVEVYWKDCLEFRYKMLNKEFQNSEEESKLRSSQLDKLLEFSREVQKVTVEAPKGRRSIVSVEAENIVSVTVQAAEYVVDSAQAKFGKNL